MRRCYSVALALAFVMVPTIATFARAQATPAKDPTLVVTNTLFSMWDARPLVAAGSHGETRIGISL